MRKTTLFLSLFSVLIFLAGANSTIPLAQGASPQPPLSTPLAVTPDGVVSSNTDDSILFNYHIEAAQVVKNLMGISSVDYVSTGPFAYDPAVTVERFSANGYLYEVNPTTNQIVHFQPISDENFVNFSSYKIGRGQYRPKAIELINRLDPEIDLGNLAFQTNMDAGYFRWEDTSKDKFQNGQSPSAEVVYAPDGRLFSYTNTLHLDPTIRSNSMVSIPMAITPTTLAAPGTYFSTTGSPWYTASGGYSGTTYKYSMDGSSSRYGTWSYPINEYVQSVIAWIPNVSETLASQARYTVVYNNGSYTTSILCNQNLHKGGYCQPIVNGIPNFQYLWMVDSTSSSERQAFDEVFLN